MSKLLEQLCNIAYYLLVSGAQVSCVEKKLEVMCKAYGFVKTDVFIITSAIIVTVKNAENRIITITKRIHGYHTNFYRLECLERFTEEIITYMPTALRIESEVKQILRKTELSGNAKRDIWLYAGISFVFSVFFGGKIQDGFGAALIGMGMYLIERLMEERIENRFVSHMILSMFSAGAAYTLWKMGMLESIKCAVIGNIMLMIPGLALVKGCRDMIVGDLITGLLGLIDSFIQAAGIAIGFIFVFWLF